MTARQWTTELDERPLEIRAEVRESDATLGVWIDGFPAHREPLPRVLDGHHAVVLDVDGHRLAVLVVPGPRGHLSLQAALDGAGLDDGRPEGLLANPSGQGPSAGGLTPDLGRYYRHDPTWLRRSGLSAVAGLTFAGWGAALAWSSAGPLPGAAQTLLLLGLTGLLTALGWMTGDARRVRSMVAHGRTAPAVVVCAEPLTVAVALDLGLPHREAWPAVRVRRLPHLDLDAPDPPRPGDRTLVWLDLHDPQDGDRYHDVSLVPVDWALSDPGDRARLHARLSSEEWARLDRSLERAGRPTEPGLYPLRPGVAVPRSSQPGSRRS